MNPLQLNILIAGSFDYLYLFRTTVRTKPNSPGYNFCIIASESY